MKKNPICDIAFTSSVKAAQEQRGSRRSYERMEQRSDWPDKITSELAEFISQRDSFYLGTVNSEGQPYIQHRGGEKGFLKVLDEQTLACADFAGNAQYISLGNLQDNNKAFLFLMDYPNRRRIKVWGTAEFVEGDDELLGRLRSSEYHATPERVLLFHVKAWSVNCPQHIQPRWTESEIRPQVEELVDRVAELEIENESLHQELRLLRAQPKTSRFSKENNHAQPN